MTLRLGVRPKLCHYARSPRPKPGQWQRQWDDSPTQNIDGSGGTVWILCHGAERS